MRMWERLKHWWKITAQEAREELALDREIIEAKKQLRRMQKDRRHERLQLRG
jgi:hypothetical protein